MLKIKYPDKEYPSNTGQKWTDEEETLLFEELNQNMDIEFIAKTHNRTIGGINARRKEIAYKLYSSNNSMEEIIMKTKLDGDQIIEIIKKRQNSPKKCKTTTETEKSYSIESEINEMKNDIKELKHTINELVEMMKAVYEFEDA
jgi:hypothetical protein